MNRSENCGVFLRACCDSGGSLSCGSLRSWGEYFLRQWFILLRNLLPLENIRPLMSSSWPCLKLRLMKEPFCSTKSPKTTRCRSCGPSLKLLLSVCTGSRLEVMSNSFLSHHIVPYVRAENLQRRDFAQDALVQVLQVPEKRLSLLKNRDQPLELKGNLLIFDVSMCWRRSSSESELSTSDSLTVFMSKLLLLSFDEPLSSLDLGSSRCRTMSFSRWSSSLSSVAS